MKYVLFIILILCCVSLSAQQKDTTSLMGIHPLGERTDTLKTTTKDSLSFEDTTKSKKKYDVDATVYAEASDSLIFDVQKKKMYLHGSGELKYKTTDLKSAKIFVDYQTNELEAFGVADTSDTAKTKMKETPVLTEGGQSYEGTNIKYNFKNQRGFISLAKNREKEQRYEGELVNKVDKNTFFIKSGMYTTCEKDTPDTYFSASEMKVIQKDKVFARWIFMYVGGVPFPIPLPFAVFPNETGRRSGIIVPTYGQDINRGQYFRNFGYFVAMNNYMDLALTGDYYTKGGWGARSRFRYAERYNFSGTINAGISRILIGEVNDPKFYRQNQTDWNIAWFHNQQINPSTRFDVNLQFISSNYLVNNSIGYSDLLKQNIVSNVSFSKTWDESGASLYINYNRTQNLDKSGNIYESLPNINFTKSITYPFKKENSESSNDQKWYEMIGYSYTGQFTNNRTKISGNLDIKSGIQHTINLSVSPKLGYFNIAPRINYTEKWYNKRTKIENIPYEVVDSTGKTKMKDSLYTSSIKEMNFVRTFDMSVTASTKIYGIFNPNILGVESFRHQLLPSISYNYQPNFASDTWGYYDSYKKLNGEVVRYDKFDREVFRGISAGQKQVLNFSLGNIFEIKLAKSASDTTKEQKKIQLLNLNADVSYNFLADSLKLSNLNLNYRTQIGDLINFSGFSSYTFYDYKDGTQLNQFLASKGKGLLRLMNFSFSISTVLSGEKIKSSEKKPESDKQKGEGFSAFEKKDYIS
ncbi:MAG: putative LPS assembly protein LptD, partial [Bacteroidota bacterium]